MFDKTFRLILVLMVISMVSALVLAATYQVTEPLIRANRSARQQENIKGVLPQAVHFQEQEGEGFSIFEGYNEEGELVGLAVNKVGPGFQGPISLVIGFEKDTLAITGVRVQEMAETPGLGARITEDWFLKQFRGHQRGSTFDDYDIIAGATVSANAVTQILEETLELMESLYGKEGE